MIKYTESNPPPPNQYHNLFILETLASVFPPCIPFGVWVGMLFSEYTLFFRICCESETIFEVNANALPSSPGRSGKEAELGDKVCIQRGDVAKSGWQFVPAFFSGRK